MGYICNTMGYFGLKFKLKYGINLVKIMGFFSKNMGYIWQ